MNEKWEKYTDDELIARLRDGQTEIEEFLMNKYKGMVRAQSRLLYLEGGDKEDLLQEGMWGLFKAIREYDADKQASFSTFAKVCVSHQMYSAIEASQRQKHLPLNEAVYLDDPEVSAGLPVRSEDDPEAILVEEEKAKELEERIKQNLSRMENKVLTLYLAGNDYRQIALQLGKSEKSIDNAIQRIRKKVKTCTSQAEDTSS